MPPKNGHKEQVNCPCGIITSVKINVAQCNYSKRTEFTCECGAKYNIDDYWNGIVTVTPVDESETLKYKFNYKGYIIIVAHGEDGKEIVYPIWADGTGMDDNEGETCDTVERCVTWVDQDIKCREEEKDKEERAGLNPEAIADILLDDMDGYGQNIKEMLTWYLEKRPQCLREWQDWFLDEDIKMPKSCFNHCPKCGAGEDCIDWGDKEWLDNQAYQSAECKKCGCEFKEYYKYTDTEIDGEN